jgi:hypothetical protein
VGGGGAGFCGGAGACVVGARVGWAGGGGAGACVVGWVAGVVGGAAGVVGSVAGLVVGAGDEGADEAEDEPGLGGVLPRPKAAPMAPMPQHRTNSPPTTASTMSNTRFFLGLPTPGMPAGSPLGG